LAWARKVLADPARAAQQMLWAALAQNAGLTPAQISGATDARSCPPWRLPSISSRGRKWRLISSGAASAPSSIC
jgi:hypothetical protein